jgi:hypothetical protein
MFHSRQPRSRASTAAFAASFSSGAALPELRQHSRRLL